MIIEQAFVNVLVGQEAAFEKSVAEAAPKTLALAPGFISYQLRRGIERPSAFCVVVEWRSLEDHGAYRESPAFAEWRGAIGSFFDGPPSAEHWTNVE